MSLVLVKKSEGASSNRQCPLGGRSLIMQRARNHWGTDQGSNIT